MSDRLAIERDREQRIERERARWDYERRFREMDDRRGRLDDVRGRIDMDYDRRYRLDMEDRRGEVYDRDNRRYDRGYGHNRRDVSEYDRGYLHERLGRGVGQEPPRQDLFPQRPRQDMVPRTLSQESLDRLGGGGGFVRMGSPVHSARGGFGHSPMHSSGGLGSPLHSSEFSLKSSESGDERLDSLSQVGEKRRRQDYDTEITEEMIEFVMMNPRIMKRWQNLAHAAGLSGRVEVIKARIRTEGRDWDEHVAEFLREWMEQKPEAATLGGLINLLKDQRFNDTAPGTVVHAWYCSACPDVQSILARIQCCTLERPRCCRPPPPWASTAAPARYYTPSRTLWCNPEKSLSCRASYGTSYNNKNGDPSSTRNSRPRKEAASSQLARTTKQPCCCS